MRRQPGTMAPAPQIYRSRKGRRAKRRGQAMIEYSMLNALLVLALMIGVSLRVVPAPFPVPGAGGRMNVIEVMLWAYHTYYDGIYLVLNSPYP
jgi:hypothetical protein